MCQKHAVSQLRLPKKCHKLGDSNQANLVSQLGLEGMTRCQHGQMLSVLSPWLAEATSHCALTGKEREGASSWVSLLIKALTPSWGPHLQDLI